MRTLTKSLVALFLLILVFTTSQPASALTGAGLPNGCQGGEAWINYGSPDNYDWEDGHLVAVYYFPYTTYGSYKLCWLSFHGTMNTDAYDGGSDNWDAVLRDGQLRILIPRSLWFKYRWQGWSTSTFISNFYLWTYWEK